MPDDGLTTAKPDEPSLLFNTACVVIEVNIEFLSGRATYRIVASDINSPVVRNVAVAPVEIALVKGELGAPPVETGHLDACTKLATCKELGRNPLA